MTSTVLDRIYSKYLSTLPKNTVVFVYTGEFDTSLWRISFNFRVEVGDTNHPDYTSDIKTVSFVDEKYNDVEFVSRISDVTIVRNPKSHYPQNFEGYGIVTKKTESKKANENKVVDCSYAALYFPPIDKKNCSKIQTTSVSLYSSTPYKYNVSISKIISDIVGNDVVVADATSCIGADTIGFALKFREVIGFERDTTNYNALQNNVDVFRLKNTHLVRGDFTQEYQQAFEKYLPDVLYMDPPWGGKEYKDENSVELFLSGKNITDLIDEINQEFQMKLVVLKVPLNYSQSSLVKLEKYGVVNTTRFPKFMIICIQLRELSPSDLDKMATLSIPSPEMSPQDADTISMSHYYYTRPVDYIPYENDKNKYLMNDITTFPQLPYAEPDNNQENLIRGMKTTVNYRSLHWGQRKLLLTEIDFLTRVGANDEIVIYAGAADGRHIPLLLDLFPLIKFHLYDPRPFNTALFRHKDRIFINPYYEKEEIKSDERGFFTDRVAQWYKNNEETRNQKILFVSDIRTEAIESEVLRNQQQQMEWIGIMKPEYSMFKFKMPYPAVGKNMYYEYLDGNIVKQCWAPIRSAETRLIIPKSQHVKKWNIIDYERQCSWYNSVLRQGDFGGVKLRDVGVDSDATVGEFWNRILSTSGGIVFGSDFVYELQILQRYVTFNKNYYNRYYTLTNIISKINDVLLNPNESFLSRLRRITRNHRRI
jgi:predicted RNA methylase